MTSRFDRRVGDKVGEWVLVDELGLGGNSEVWVANSPDGKRVALKIVRVRNPMSEPYRRFRDEVRVHRSLSGERGILPLIDASLLERPGRDDPAWLATEIADPLAAVLADAPIEDVVHAVATVAWHAGQPAR